MGGGPAAVTVHDRERTTQSVPVEIQRMEQVHPGPDAPRFSPGRFVTIRAISRIQSCSRTLNRGLGLSAEPDRAPCDQRHDQFRKRAMIGLGPVPKDPDLP